MKNLFLILVTLLSFTSTSLASNIGDGEISVVKTEKVELTLESEGQKEFILKSTFNVEDDNVDMMFKSTVSMVQIYNETGELEMMFPIGSTKVSLGLSLFDGGEYRMGFIVEGIEDVQFTNLKIK